MEKKQRLKLLVQTRTSTEEQIMMMQIPKKMFRAFGADVGKTKELMMVTS